MESIEVCLTTDEVLNSLLKDHPKLKVTAQTCSDLQFSLGHWHRVIKVNDSASYPAGLLESMDNNPLVCADVVNVPGPGETLLLIALVPLIKASFLLEPPVYVSTDPISVPAMQCFLEEFRHDFDVEVMTEGIGERDLVAGSLIAKVPNGLPLSVFEGLFDEIYGRSFFVRKATAGVWEESQVLGTPIGMYQLGIESDGQTTLLKVRVMADRNGKCGAAQILQFLNVMCGFEEDLGVNLTPAN